MYLFSSHVKILEKAQLYFKLFDFDNDEKITPSDLMIYLGNLEKDTDTVLKETKAYLYRNRKLNKKDYILEITEFANADTNKQIANLIVKEASSKGKNYIDFFDFRHMFLNMQFIPEYSFPLYLEEEFQGDPIPMDNTNDRKQKVTQDIFVPVEEDEQNSDLEEDED